MEGARPLSAAFLATAPVSSSMTPDLETTLAAMAARGREAFPELASGPDDKAFAAFLGARVAASDLDSARAPDLFAACACGTGDGRAIVAIEARYFPDVDAALRKMGLSSDRASEVKQGLRRVLFVGDEATNPRIGDYRGTGDLRGWLRVTAMRAALKLLRKDGRETANDDALLEARAQTDDPELSYMKATYRAAFKVAFQEALESLQARERTLLKQQIVDGLGIDELGALYQVHRATAARWVQGAREKLLSRTRRLFMVNARISSDECESIMRLVRSQLDVSLHRRLGSG